MSAGLVQAAYIVAAVFFIMSLAGLSKQESARMGNYYGIAGMAIALLATIFSPSAQGVAWVLLAMVIGGGIGIHYAKKVEMTEMPELVAVLHSFVGMAAVLVGFNSYIDAPEAATHAEHVIHLVVSLFRSILLVLSLSQVRLLLSASYAASLNRHH